MPRLNLSLNNEILAAADASGQDFYSAYIHEMSAHRKRRGAWPPGARTAEEEELLRMLRIAEVAERTKFV
jgi:hypothetical protein